MTFIWYANLQGRDVQIHKIGIFSMQVYWTWNNIGIRNMPEFQYQCGIQMWIFWRAIILYGGVIQVSEGTLFWDTGTTLATKLLVLVLRRNVKFQKYQRFQFYGPPKRVSASILHCFQQEEEVAFPPLQGKRKEAGLQQPLVNASHKPTHR